MKPVFPDIAIKKAVCSVMGITLPQLEARSRGKKPFANARMVAMRTHYRLSPSPSYVQTARAFDRERTTARHAVERVEEDPALLALSAQAIILLRGEHGNPAPAL